MKLSIVVFTILAGFTAAAPANKGVNTEGLTVGEINELFPTKNPPPGDKRSPKGPVNTEGLTVGEINELFPTKNPPPGDKKRSPKSPTIGEINAAFPDREPPPQD